MAEQGVDRRAAATHDRVVYSVIVHERRQVDQLGDAGQCRRTRLGRPVHVACKQ